MTVGIIFALLSAILSTLSAVFQKKVLKNISVISFSFLINLLILIYTLFLLPYISLDISLWNNILLIIKSLFVNVAFFFVMRSIQQLNLSEALPLLALSPIPLSLFAALILNEYLTFLQGLALLSILLGVYLIELPNSKDLFHPFKLLIQKKYHTVLIALGIFITTSIIDRYLLSKQNFPVLQIILYQHFIGALFFFFLLLLHKEAKTLQQAINPVFWIIVLISIFTIGYRIFEFLSVKNIPVAIAISLKRVSVLIAVVIGGKYFKEEHLKYRIPATVLILTGITIFLLQR
ncbi:MAG TPA: DMT family transporter [Ignavibacteriales bacterium]|nr:DMT family transporter [Ignavibacteriales bacterium]